MRAIFLRVVCMYALYFGICVSAEPYALRICVCIYAEGCDSMYTRIVHCSAYEHMCAYELRNSI